MPAIRNLSLMNRKHRHNTPIGIAICTLHAQGDGSIQLFPSGQFDAPRGAMAGSGPWFIDDVAATALIERVQQRNNDIVVDYEHQTLSSVNNGQPAPAAGWLKPSNIHWVAGKGLMASDPKWTDKAKSHIDGDEYRYLSPVFSYDKKTGRVLDLLHVALTNNPAIDGMDDVVLAAAKFLPTHQQEEPLMDKELLKLLGLEDGASVDDVVAALTAMQTNIAALTAQLAEKDEAIAAASAATPDSAVAAITGLQEQLAALTAQVNDGQVDDVIAAAKAQGKVMPALEPWLREMAKNQGVAALKSYIDVAPAVAALTNNQSDGRTLDDDGNPVLTAEQVAVCSQMGISQEDFKKTLAEEA